MSKKIQVYNDKLDATVLVPEAALEHYAERGWVPVEEDEPVLNLGSPRYRGNDSQSDEDDLESDEDTSDDQEE